MEQAEKTSFIIYGSYEEQFHMLSDDQAGQLIKGIFAYVRTGERIDVDPLVNMLFSIIASQLDHDKKKYMESRERRIEAARKAGKASAEKRAQKREMPLQNTETSQVEPDQATNVDETQRFQPVYVDVDDNVDADGNVDVNVDADVDDLSKTGRRRHRHEEEARPREENDRIFVPYGGDQVATTEAEYQKVEQLARELFRSHAGKTPSPFDVEQVFRYVHRPAYDANGDAYARYDTGKAELLRFVFERASLQNRMSWSYIDGIFSNYGRCGVETVGEAEEKEYCWNRLKA